MLSEAVNSPNIKLAYIFIEKSLAEDFQLPDNTEVFVLDNKLIAEIADTETPQGIVAVVEKPRWELDNIKKIMLLCSYWMVLLILAIWELSSGLPGPLT